MGNIKAQIPEPSHGTASVWGAGRSRVLGWTQTGLIGCCWGTREELWKGLSRSCPVSIRHPFHNGIHKYIKGSKSRLSSTAAGTLILSNLTVMVKTFLICNLLVLPKLWPCINEGFEQSSQTSFNQDKVIVPTAFFFTWLSPFLTFIPINDIPNTIATKFPLPNDIPCQTTALIGQQALPSTFPFKAAF